MILLLYRGHIFWSHILLNTPTAHSHIPLNILFKKTVIGKKGIAVGSSFQIFMSASSVHLIDQHIDLFKIQGQVVWVAGSYLGL